MTDPLKNEEENEDWVEISDGQGRKAALRHIATVCCGEKNYHVLGAVREDGEENTGRLLLVREDQTVDGAREYVITSDEAEIERVVCSFVSQVLSAHLPEILEAEEEQEAPCGVCHHGAWEFCCCGEPELLQ